LKLGGLRGQGGFSRKLLQLGRINIGTANSNSLYFNELLCSAATP
jgi:hypothetical protein